MDGLYTGDLSEGWGGLEWFMFRDWPSAERPYRRSWSKTYAHTYQTDLPSLGQEGQSQEYCVAPPDQSDKSGEYQLYLACEPNCHRRPWETHCSQREYDTTDIRHGAEELLPCGVPREHMGWVGLKYMRQWGAVSNIQIWWRRSESWEGWSLQNGRTRETGKREDVGRRNSKDNGPSKITPKEPSPILRPTR